MMNGRRLLIVGVAVCAGLAAAAELGLRSMGIGNPLLLQSDAGIGYVFAPDQEVTRRGNRIAINAYHQRSAEIALLPASGTDRILVLGDSVTFGGGSIDQDDTYPERLAALLRASGRHAEVLNASAGSWGLGNELAYLQRFGAFGSRVLVLQVGSHDLLQPASGSGVVGVHPAYPDRKPSSALSELADRYLLPLVLGGEAAGIAPWMEAPDDAQFERNMESLAAIVALARSEGADVIVLHTPDQFEVQSDSQDGLAFRERYRARFLAMLERLDVAVVNLREEWRGVDGAPGYFRDGTHLTVAGNEAIADRLAAELGRRDAGAD